MEASTSSFSSSLNNNSPTVNFHFETEEKTNQKAIQPFKLDPLNPYKLYDVKTIISSIKSVVPIRQPKLKSVYKSSEVAVQSISTSSKETYFLFSLHRTSRDIGLKHIEDCILVQLDWESNLYFLQKKNVTCFLTILDIRWQTFERL